MSTYDIKVIESVDDGTTKTETLINLADAEMTPMARHTTAQIAALSGMAGGSMVYDTDKSCCQVRAGGAWKNATEELTEMNTTVFGAFTSGTLNFKFYKVGNRVSMVFPGVSGTTTSVNKLQLNGTIDASLRPSATNEIPYIYWDGAANVVGKVDVQSGGAILFGPVFGNFASGVLINLKPMTFTWYV